MLILLTQIVILQFCQGLVVFLVEKVDVPWLSDVSAFRCNCGNVKFPRITTACGGIWEPQ